MINLSGINEIITKDGIFKKVNNKQLFTDGKQIIETAIMETLINTMSFFGTVEIKNHTVIVK